MYYGGYCAGTAGTQRRALGRGDVRGMVDSSPLQQFLRANLSQQDGSVVGIHDNLQEAVIEAIAIITTNYASGRSEAWVQSTNDELWQQGQLLSQPAEISLPHILASAALPMFFPAVSLNGQWHGDGGIRLSAPLSPAMHLGADRIFGGIAKSAKRSRRRDDQLRLSVSCADRGCIVEFGISRPAGF